MYPKSILTEKGESRGLRARPKTGPDNAHKSVRASTGARGRRSRNAVIEAEMCDMQQHNAGWQKKPSYGRLRDPVHW